MIDMRKHFPKTAVTREYDKRQRAYCNIKQL